MAIDEWQFGFHRVEEQWYDYLTYVNIGMYQNNINFISSILFFELLNIYHFNFWNFSWKVLDTSLLWALFFLWEYSRQRQTEILWTSEYAEAYMNTLHIKKVSGYKQISDLIFPNWKFFKKLKIKYLNLEIKYLSRINSFFKDIL